MLRLLCDIRPEQSAYPTDSHRPDCDRQEIQEEPRELIEVEFRVLEVEPGNGYVKCYANRNIHKTLPENQTMQLGLLPVLDH